MKIRLNYNTEKEYRLRVFIWSILKLLRCVLYGTHKVTKYHLHNIQIYVFDTINRILYSAYGITGPYKSVRIYFSAAIIYRTERLSQYK